MDYDSAGRFTAEKAKMMLKILREKVPHIYWELGWGEGYLNEVSRYSDICVPEFQIDEAEYVIGLLEKGQDLNGYRLDGRFPLLFEKDNGLFYVVKPIASFAEKVQELINSLDADPGDDMVEYLRKISKLLLNVYTLQYDLPDCTGGAYYQPGLSFSLPVKLGPFSVYFDVSDPFKKQVADRYLEKTLENILETLYTGIIHYNMYKETSNYKYLLIAVNVWKNQYSGEHGWGTAVANALKVIHYASMYLQQGRLPQTGVGNGQAYETIVK